MLKLLQFLQGHPKHAFSEKVQGGTKGNFSKISQEVALVWKNQNQAGKNVIIR